MGDTLIAMPLHEQVKERIVERITDGTWGAGDVLPPENELATLLGVSYGTIRRSMADLVNEGIVMRRRRTGTIVTGRMPNHTLSRFYKYYRLQTAEGHLTNTTTHVRSVTRTIASPEDCQRLNLSSDQPEVHEMLRIRECENGPVMIDRFLIPVTRVPDFPQDPDKAPVIIFQWLLESYGIRLGAVHEKVTARLAQEEEKRWLKKPLQLPLALLDIDALALDTMNEPLLVMRHAALTEVHCYVNEMR